MRGSEGQRTTLALCDVLQLEPASRPNRELAVAIGRLGSTVQMFLKDNIACVVAGRAHPCSAFSAFHELSLIENK